MNPDAPYSKWVLAILSLIIFVVVAWVSNLEKGLAAGITAVVFISIVQMKWASRKDWRLWAIVALFTVIHIAIISIVKFPQIRAGLISLPFALVDGLVIWTLINWVEKHFPRAGKLSEP